MFTPTPVLGKPHWRSQTKFVCLALSFSDNRASSWSPLFQRRNFSALILPWQTPTCCCKIVSVLCTLWGHEIPSPALLQTSNWGVKWMWRSIIAIPYVYFHPRVCPVSWVKDLPQGPSRWFIFVHFVRAVRLLNNSSICCWLLFV